jgi:hypothetical protein
MKFLVVLSLFSMTLNCFAEGKPVRTSPIFDKLGIKPETTKSKTVKEVEVKKEADCDTKAKQPIEIKPETMSLSGNTGCSLDEIKN